MAIAAVLTASKSTRVLIVPYYSSWGKEVPPADQVLGDAVGCGKTATKSAGIPQMSAGGSGGRHTPLLVALRQAFEQRRS